jgi:hypothetical protein
MVVAAVGGGDGCHSAQFRRQNKRRPGVVLTSATSTVQQIHDAALTGHSNREQHHSRALKRGPAGIAVQAAVTESPDLPPPTIAALRTQ